MIGDIFTSVKYAANVTKNESIPYNIYWLFRWQNRCVRLLEIEEYAIESIRGRLTRTIGVCWNPVAYTYGKII